jgi:hypothetical protein
MILLRNHMHHLNQENHSSDPLALCCPAPGFNIIQDQKMRIWTNATFRFQGRIHYVTPSGFSIFFIPHWL